MKEVNPEPIDGTVEMDETYISGKKTGLGISAAKKAKVPVFGIKQCCGDLPFFRVEDVKPGTLAKYIKENVSADMEVIMTDESSTYPMAISKAGIENLTRP